MPVKLDATGNFYQKFDAQTPATGDYLVKFEPDGAKPKRKRKTGQGRRRRRRRRGSRRRRSRDRRTDTPAATFRSRRKPIACRPSRCCSTRRRWFRSTASSRSIFWRAISPAASSAERPVKWRASQFPYAWTPPGREGFLFSTDARFSSDGKFKSTAGAGARQRTDAGGAARISFDTTIEPTAQPRRYSDRGDGHRRRRDRGAQCAQS